MGVPSLSATWGSAERSFDGDRAVVVGRGDQLDITVGDDRVSRRHCELRPGEDNWTVVDLGSRNGTWVDGQRAGSHDLHPGRTVQVTLGAVDGPALSLTVGSGDAEPARLRVAATLATTVRSAPQQRITSDGTRTTTWSLRTHSCRDGTPSLSGALASPFSATSTASTARFSTTAASRDQAATTARRRRDRRRAAPLGWRPLAPLPPARVYHWSRRTCRWSPRRARSCWIRSHSTMPAGTLTAVIGPSGAGQVDTPRRLNGLAAGDRGVGSLVGPRPVSRVRPAPAASRLRPARRHSAPAAQGRRRPALRRTTSPSPRHSTSRDRPSSRQVVDEMQLARSTRTARRDRAFRWAAQACLDRDGAADSAARCCSSTSQRRDWTPAWTSR